MPRKDDAARRARARALRMQIEQLVSGEAGTSAAAPGAPAGQESPAEFVERRMREIEAEKRKKKRGTGTGRTRRKR